MGYLLVALGGGVGVVGLHVAGGAVDVLEEEGDEGDAIFFREGGVHGVKFFDVVGAVVGGEGDAGEGDVGSVGLELMEDAIEVGLGLFEGEAAEAVVAAEFNDNDAGMAGEDAGDAVEAVFGGVAGDAGVEDMVVEVAGVEEALEFVGIGLAGVGAEACGEGVAEADEERAVLHGRRRASRGCLLLRWRGGSGCGGRCCRDGGLRRGVAGRGGAAGESEGRDGEEGDSG